MGPRNATYKGVVQHGDYSLWTIGSHSDTWWMNYYYASAPHPSLGMQERVNWEKRTALFASKLKEAGIDVGNPFA